MQQPVTPTDTSQLLLSSGPIVPPPSNNFSLDSKFSFQQLYLFSRPTSSVTRFDCWSRPRKHNTSLCRVSWCSICTQFRGIRPASATADQACGSASFGECQWRHPSRNSHPAGLSRQRPRQWPSQDPAGSPWKRAAQ